VEFHLEFISTAPGGVNAYPESAAFEMIEHASCRIPVSLGNKVPVVFVTIM